MINILAFGIIIIFFIIAIAKFDRKIEVIYKLLSRKIRYTNEKISLEAKKTRKEDQEIKTRLTQVRKDLNRIERLLTKKSK